MTLTAAASGSSWTATGNSGPICLPGTTGPAPAGWQIRLPWQRGGESHKYWPCSCGTTAWRWTPAPWTGGRTTATPWTWQSPSTTLSASASSWTTGPTSSARGSWSEFRLTTASSWSSWWVRGRSRWVPGPGWGRTRVSGRCWNKSQGEGEVSGTGRRGKWQLN